MSILNSIDTDSSDAGLSFKLKITQSLVFGFVGIALLIGMHLMPHGNQYAGILPGICFGLMAGLVGSAVSSYKKPQKNMES